MSKMMCRIMAVFIVGLLSLPAVPQADTAQYFYDELGRLVGVVDGQGNAAVYTYDEVGNLLSMTRNTGGVGTTTISTRIANSSVPEKGSEVEELIV